MPEVADVIWPKKYPFVVRGKVTFDITLVDEEYRYALANATELIDSLQHELKSYYIVNSVRWEVHTHDASCNKKTCPCFAAGYKARAEDRDAYFAAKKELGGVSDG